MFDKQKLLLVRKLRGLTKKDLASSLGISQKTFSDWEKGKVTPKFENLIVVAEKLKFPVDFFYSHNTFSINTENISFRALTKMSALDRDIAIANMNLARLINEWLENNFNLPQVDIPNLEHLEPEQAAQHLRKIWNLSECINNTIHLLEKHGVRVYSMNEECNDYDALSTWFNQKPFILLKTTKSAERSRFDAMHELGHLVLHRNVNKRDRITEDEANRFASEMLMPKESIYKHKPSATTLTAFIQIKKLWKVSLGAVIYRYNKLGFLSEWVYRSLFLQARKWGYDKNEPNPIEKEQSKIFEQVYKLLKEDNKTILNLSQELFIPAEDINKLIFSIYPSSIVSGNINNKPTIKLI